MERRSDNVFFQAPSPGHDIKQIGAAVGREPGPDVRHRANGSARTLRRFIPPTLTRRTVLLSYVACVSSARRPPDAQACP